MAPRNDSLDCFRHVAGVVAATNERSASNFFEAHLFGRFAKFVEFFRRDIAIDV